MLLPRQPHREHRAFAGLARDRHVAAHHAGKLARDGKAQAGAAEALRGRGVGLGEFLEQFRLLLGRHADAGVGDGELDEARAVARPARGKLHLARVGELAGIAEQIEQDLAQPHRIDGERPEILLLLDQQAILVLFGQLPSGADNVNKITRGKRLFPRLSLRLRRLQRNPARSRRSLLISRSRSRRMSSLRTGSMSWIARHHWIVRRNS